MKRAYWDASRAPRYSLVFALPLLIGYQVLAALQPVSAHGSLRNGADVVLEGLSIALAGRYGPWALMIGLIALGVWLVVRDMRRHGTRLRAVVFLGMTAEVVLLALTFGFVVGTLTSQLVRPPVMLAGARQIESMTWAARVMLSLGAGIYEELLFRVVLVAALAWFARSVLRWRPLPAGVLAVIIGALLFSAFHYIGPYGDRLTLYSFLFRMIAGVFFSALYLLRGFGITAWTHALYDVMLLLV